MSEKQHILRKRILVVDDDEALNNLLCEFLSDKGFVTIKAFSLAQAMHILKIDDEIDLLLLDYQLTDGNGITLLQQLHMDRQLNEMPVIMISSNAAPDFLEDCFELGVTDYVVKPINLSSLVLKISALIKSVVMQQVIREQNSELARFKQEAEREESVAKFIYEYLLRQNSQHIEGVSIWLKSLSSFSGDIALAKISPRGDFYFLLADATGHGLSAAITVMPVVTIFNSMVAKGFHIKSIVAEINRKLIRDTPPDRFVAAILIQMQPSRKEIDVWNGGMPTAYWLNQGEIVKAFRSQHMALGILDEDMFDTNVVTCDFSEQGIIITYSDGLIEETNAEGNSFSLARVTELVKNESSNVQLVLINALKEFTGRDQYKDDVSICMLEPKKIYTNCAQQLHDRF